VLIEAIGGVWGWEHFDAAVSFRVITPRQLAIDKKLQSGTILTSTKHAEHVSH
jgi:hypothetical protein